MTVIDSLEHLYKWYPLANATPTMAAKKCASCTKSVFPMEELKCLDKVWHKGCFKCQVCNMTLNMKNYKGYDKLPYCNAHYPETKFTAVADTPESKRLAQNSKIQSNIKYHAEYEKERGQYTSVADDPETLRVKKNMETISNASYHGDLARRQEMENTRPNEYEPRDAPPRSYQAPPTSYQAPPTSYTAPPQQRPPSQSYQSSNFMDFTQPVPINIPYDYRPPAQGPKSYSRPVMTIGKGEAQAIAQQPMAPPPQQGYGRRAGSITDYDPNSGLANSPYSSKTQSTTAYSSQARGGGGGGLAQRLSSSSSSSAAAVSSSGDYSSSQYNPPRQQPGSAQQQPYSYQQSQEPYGGVQRSAPSQQSYTPAGSGQQAYRPPYNPAMAPPPMQQQRGPPPQQQRGPPPQQQQPSRDPFYGKGKVSKSLYDYSAADEDEISFLEDDIIINCEPIDDGWMMGRVERTGHQGMLPSNYVEPLNW